MALWMPTPLKSKQRGGEFKFCTNFICIIYVHPSGCAATDLCQVWSRSSCFCHFLRQKFKKKKTVLDLRDFLAVCHRFAPRGRRRTQSGQRADIGRTPSGQRADNERTPRGGHRADTGRTPSGQRADTGRGLCACVAAGRSGHLSLCGAAAELVCACV